MAGVKVNAKMGSGEAIEDAMVQFGLGKRIERGERLIQFHTEEK